MLELLLFEIIECDWNRSQQEGQERQQARRVCPPARDIRAVEVLLARLRLETNLLSLKGSFEVSWRSVIGLASAVFRGLAVYDFLDFELVLAESFVHVKHASLSSKSQEMKLKCYTQLLVDGVLSKT